MSANQRKIAVLQNLLERVQTRAASPRAARATIATAAVAVAAAAPVEAMASLADAELTPLIPSSALSMPEADEPSLTVADELTPSEEIEVVELTPAPEEAELEVVVDDELASEAALIEEALSSDDEDEAPASSLSRAPHSLEAAMEPMTLDPISDRPTARITLPPESGPQLSATELAPAAVPYIEPPSDADDLEPEITISSEPADVAWIGDEPSIEQLGGVIDLDEPAEALDLELLPPESGTVPAPEAVDELEADLGSDSGAGVFSSELPPPPEAAAELADQDRKLEEGLAAQTLELEVEEVAEEAELLVEPPVAPPPLPSAAPAAAELLLAKEASPPPLEPVPSLPKPAPVSVELTAEVMRRPVSGDAKVAAIVGAATQFAPKTFSELLDASLKL